MKIFIHIPDGAASSYYRSVLPYLHCFHECSCRGIKLVSGKQPETGEPFDAYFLQRIIKPQFWTYAQELIRNGAKIIWQTDDDLWNIPEWNPAYHKVTALDKNVLSEVVERAHHLVTSTQYLADKINKPEKTHVLPNLIDEMDFRNYDRKPNQPVKILWTGSFTHSEDLSKLIEPIQKVIEKYQDRVKFIFWGFFPSGLFDVKEYEGLPTFKPKHEKNVAFLNWMDGNQYFEILGRVQPDIALGPLADCEFNRCKSSLRSLEMSMAGAAFVGSDITPYQWIENGVTGRLVKDEWFEVLSELIEDEELRREMSYNAREQIWEEFSWQSNSKYKWIDAFQSFVAK